MLKLRPITGLEKRWLKNCVSVMVGFVIIIVAGIVLFTSASNYANLRTGLQNKANTICKMLQSHYAYSGDFKQSCISYTSSFEDREVTELQYLDASGKRLASSCASYNSISADAADVRKVIETDQTATFQGKTSNGEKIYSVTVPLFDEENSRIGMMRFIVSLKNTDLENARLSIISFAVGIALIICIIIVSSYFLQSIVKPITDITATAKRIAGGSYGVQISHKFNDEIGELADTVNDMSVKIGQSEKTQSEFISSVSHELRTPLTAISGWGETLISAENLDPEMRRGMMIILREARRLTGMVEELLEFTRMQNGRFTLNVEQADILAEFEDTVFMYGSRLKQEDIILNYTPDDEPIPEIPCDVSRMRQVFLNILDNAAKHGGTGKQIDASIKLEDGKVVIRIRDYGPGIPEDELPHVKMKFYKGSSKARGSGIGLAVCEEIVTMHGGTLSLENAVGGGTLVTVCIPCGKE